VSDEEERILWRRASQESPEVVKWIQALLRSQKLPLEVQIPLFTRSLLAPKLVLSAYGCGTMTLQVPQFINNQYCNFHLVGMSLMVSTVDPEEINTLSQAPLRIQWNDRYYNQLLGTLLVKNLDPPFRPGWITSWQLPAATTLFMEIENHVLKTMIFQWAVHGSFDGELL